MGLLKLALFVGRCLTNKNINWLLFTKTAYNGLIIRTAFCLMVLIFDGISKLFVSFWCLLFRFRYQFFGKRNISVFFLHNVIVTVMFFHGVDIYSLFLAPCLKMPYLCTIESDSAFLFTCKIWSTKTDTMNILIQTS